MRNSKMRDKTGKYLLSTAAMLAVVATVASINPVVANDHDHDKDDQVTNPNKLKTATPIKHLVIVFNENRSFDHYFGTYPNALNPEGEPRFEPAKDTPTDINNLLSNPSLLTNNPNLNPGNGVGASNPFRLDRTQANTRSQNHAYTPEQLASSFRRVRPEHRVDVGRDTFELVAVEKPPTSQPARVKGTQGAGAILPFSLIICALPSALAPVQYRNELWKPTEPSFLKKP
jgi:hypothetical protein